MSKRPHPAQMSPLALSAHPRANLEGFAGQFLRPVPSNPPRDGNDRHWGGFKTVGFWVRISGKLVSFCGSAFPKGR